MRRYALLPCLLAVLLLTACGRSTPADSAAPIRTTELRAGTHQCSVDVQISGDLSPEDGPWLTFSVVNHGQEDVYLSMDRDAEHASPVAPGETGSITQQLKSSAKGYFCQAAPSSAGGEVKITYTLTQSTVASS